MPGGARQETGVVSVGGELWVLGGIDAAGGTVARVEIYDPRKGQWRRGPDLPLPMHHANVAVLDGTVYVARFLIGLSENQSEPLSQATDRLSSGLREWPLDWRDVPLQGVQRGPASKNRQAGLIRRVELPKQLVELIPQSGGLGESGISLRHQQVQDRSLIVRRHAREGLPFLPHPGGDGVGVQAVGLVHAPGAPTALSGPARVDFVDRLADPYQMLSEAAAIVPCTFNAPMPLVAETVRLRVQLLPTSRRARATPVAEFASRFIQCYGYMDPLVGLHAVRGP